MKNSPAWKIYSKDAGRAFVRTSMDLLRELFMEYLECLYHGGKRVRLARYLVFYQGLQRDGVLLTPDSAIRDLADSEYCEEVWHRYHNENMSHTEAMNLFDSLVSAFLTEDAKEVFPDNEENKK